MRFRALYAFLSAAVALTFALTSSSVRASAVVIPTPSAMPDDALPAPTIFGAFNNLVAIDPATGEIEAIGPTLPFAVTAMLANPHHARLYMFERSGSRIAEVSTRTLQELSVVSVPQGLAENLGSGWLATSPSGNRIYVVDLAQDGIDVISTHLLSVVAFIPMGDFVGGVAVGDFGNRVYVSLPHQNRIAVVDPSTNEVISSFRGGLCPKGSQPEKCEIGALTIADGRYLLGASPRTGYVVGIDTTDNKVVGMTDVVFFACPFATFVGVNAAADQAALFTEGCERDGTAFVEARPPFDRVFYSFPSQKFDGSFTVAFDQTGTIGYAAGDQRFDHGELLQFTSQSFRFIPIGAPTSLVLAP